MNNFYGTRANVLYSKNVSIPRREMYCLLQPDFEGQKRDVILCYRIIVFFFDMTLEHISRVKEQYHDLKKTQIVFNC